MSFLSAAAPIVTRGEPTQLDNILTIALVVLLAVVVAIAVIRRANADKKAPVMEAPVETVVEVEAPTAPGAAGKLKLYDSDPKTAAMVMAIGADKLQQPINELRFISIKEVQ